MRMLSYWGADGTKAYVSDGGAGAVIVFNRRTLEKGASIPVGINPDGMVIEMTTGHLFVFNGKGRTLSVVDLASETVVATLPLPGKPEFPAIDGRGHVFVNIEDTHQVLKISADENRVVSTWTLAGCESPTGMTIDSEHGRLFSVCDNAKMPVLDTGTGKLVAMPGIGTGPDAVVYDAARGLLFSSNGDAGTVSIVKQSSPDEYRVFQTLKTAPKARTLALDPANGDVYVVAPDPTDKSASSPLLLLRISGSGTQ